MNIIKKEVYNKEKRNDSLYTVFETIFDYNELEKGNFEIPTKFIHLPIPIDLNRKDFFFYFSPLHGSLPKDEFLNAVEIFKEMVIRKGKPEKHCKVRIVNLKN